MYFTREDWKLFRTIDTLAQKAGVSTSKIPALVAKELIDNALDTGAECGIEKLSNDNGFLVWDNGPGIPPERLEDFFSINRPMISSKLLRLPTRGALGNGLRVVMGAVVATGGSLQVFTQGCGYNLVPQEDGSTRKHEIAWSGCGVRTIVRVAFGPHIQFRKEDLHLAETALRHRGGPAPKGKTSPHWYSSDIFFEVVNAFSGSVEELLNFFAIESVCWTKSYLTDILNLQCASLTFAQSEQLLGVMRENSKLPARPTIGSIGKEDFPHLADGYNKQSHTFTISPARGQYDATLPFTVEAWACDSTFVDRENPRVLMMVNKTPITGHIQVWRKSSNKIVLYGCGIQHRFTCKASNVSINIQTPYMPITSDGKAPDFSLMLSGIMLAVERAAKQATKNIRAIDSRVLKSEKDIVLHYLSAAIEKASGGGHYKFSQRQLYYAVRPYVITHLEKQPDYNYFCRLLTEYEAAYGDIPNLYRDPRGVLYHPHLGEEIPLGTIAVENYKRPAWTFNKILYSEKEGFFTILRDAKFPERYDCALLTSKGFASRAVKDLFDLLGDTDEDIYFFCIHDADAAGTKIYETLQGATLARPGRRIKVINLGLDPEEALGMNLEVEQVPDTKHRKAVGDYLDYEWKHWLQSNRVELNAMTSPQFLDWLEQKFDAYDIPKVIPSTDTLTSHLYHSVDTLLRKQIADSILSSAGYEDKVAAAIAQLSPKIGAKSLRRTVSAQLNRAREQHWTQPIQSIAKEIVTQ